MNNHRTFTRSTSTALAALVLLSAVAVGVGSASAASARSDRQPPGTQDESSPHGKKGHRPLTVGDSNSVVDVKFVAGTDVRVRDGRLVSLGDADMAPVDALLDRFPGTRVSRLFDGASEEDQERSRQQADADSGRVHADLNLFFRLVVGTDTDVTALVDGLNGLEIVENAAPEATPAALPTANLVGQQGYRTSAATGGVDADYAQALAGGKAEYVVITDVEYSWNRTHEDLSKASVAGSALANGTPCDPFAATLGATSTDHGTAVLGEIVGDANGFGVTGLAPAATLRTVNAASLINGICSLNLANAISIAANNSTAGDVILIEQQMAGPRKTDPKSDVGYVPVEWDQTGAVFAAIANATARGIIVIEPAGNGSQNLDDPIYNDSTGKNWFSYDSGAIMVGAGNAPGCTWGTDPTVARGRLSFSNYGSRLNVQGWGDCVWTTGYGDFQGGTNPNLWYTQKFAGTSSASPIVASSAAVLSSVAEARGTTLTPAKVRSLLISTGQPQTYGYSGLIGPLPNLRAAINALGPKLADAGHVVAGANLGATTIPVQQTWTNLTGGTVQYDVYLSTDGSTSWVKQTLSAPTNPSAVYSLERNHDYQFAARAKDASGIWGDWTYTAKFNVGEYQENYSATNPALTGTWTRSAWTPASDGYLSVASVAGSKATFTFTGTAVAWVATKSTNRGQADVYVDGVRVKTVDLYSATTSAQAVVYAASWTAPGTHTVEVRVLGTAGRPSVDVDAFVRLR